MDRIPGCVHSLSVEFPRRACRSLSHSFVRRHPHSIETIVPLSDDIVATGSSDGMVRIVSILPNKLSEFPRVSSHCLLFRPSSAPSLALIIIELR